MPKLSGKIIEKRIKALKVQESIWIKVHYPTYENGGVLDIHRNKEKEFVLTVWDTYWHNRVWIPHNHRRCIFTGAIAGTIALMRGFRKGKVT